MEKFSFKWKNLRKIFKMCSYFALNKFILQINLFFNFLSAKKDFLNWKVSKRDNNII